MGCPLQFAFVSTSPALCQPFLKIAFWFFQRQKAKKGLLWNRLIVYISLQKVLVLHFVKTIDSNINIQLKLKENPFKLCVLQNSTILILSQHKNVPKFAWLEYSLNPSGTLLIVSFLPCLPRYSQISFTASTIAELVTVSKLILWRL